MRVIRHLAPRPERLPGSVLTLGNFDGAHLGHQAIVRRAVARARESAGLAVALTFEPHPVAVLAPGRAPLMLQTLHDRLASLAGLGIDVTVVQRFTRAFAALDPEAFVRDFLLRHVELAYVVVGYNVNFGRDRAGTSETLRALGARLGFGVEVVGPVAAGDGEQVSSTRLRTLLQAGDMPRARALLGRSYALRGRVVVGDRRGRTLGFPTANLHLRAGLLLPPDGVYAVGVEVDGRAHEGLLNIGVRPTFAGRRRTIEVHLLDFSGDLYRRWLVVKLIERLRGEEAFSGPGGCWAGGRERCAARGRRGGRRSRSGADGRRGSTIGRWRRPRRSRRPPRRPLAGPRAAREHGPARRSRRAGPRGGHAARSLPRDRVRGGNAVAGEAVDRRGARAGRWRTAQERASPRRGRAARGRAARARAARGGARGGPSLRPLRGRGSARHRQAARHGRAPRARRAARHGGERARPSARGAGRGRPPRSARHRAPPRPRHLGRAAGGAHGGGARGARAAVPCAHDREGLPGRGPRAPRRRARDHRTRRRPASARAEAHERAQPARARRGHALDGARTPPGCDPR